VRRFAPFAAAALAAAIASASAQSPPAPTFQPSVETPEDLPAHPGRDETFYMCIACHGLAIVKRQALSRDGWDDMLRLMVSRHGMMEPVGEERRIILDYLAAAFPPRAPAAGGGWRNPFSQ
jgi:hypothetical protein